ncbi:MAG TPA: GDSL-type esterase/lipase family protein [Armatimonadota bacterium]|jgi:lysophospholipase L1-like esterase
MPTPRRFLAGLLGAFLFSLPSLAGRPVYLALGDSIAWGTTNAVPVSTGEQGYVKPLGDYLGAACYGGERPKVDNLAISSELSSSFFTGVNPPGWERSVAANLNYADPLQSQHDRFLATVAAEKAAGNHIDVVSFALGANDLFYLIQTPAFQDPSADRAAMVQQTFQGVGARYGTFLTELRALLPDAQLLLPTYYNPFGFLGPANALNQAADGAMLTHAGIVQAAAAQFGGTAVDFYSPFVGHETEYTYILAGDVHPNAAGYNVLAGQMERAVVCPIPEPGSLALLALGVPLTALMRRRR